MSDTQSIILASDGDRRFEAYLSKPASGRGVGLLILSEMFGVNHVMRAVADAYAVRGYCVLVPNLFWRSVPNGALDYEGDDREAAWDRLKTFDFDLASVDMRVAVDWLRAAACCSGAVAALGFCMGGRLAFLAASRAKVDAAIAFYALGISHHLAEAEVIECPVQLHYGLSDKHIPRSEIDEVGHGIAGRSDIEMYLYPEAGHSFLNEVRPTFDPSAARLAHQRIDSLLSSLRSRARS